MRNAATLHTIAHRDRVAEAAAQCGGSPARPVSGLVNTAREQHALSDRTFPHLTMQWRTTRPVTLTYRCGGSAGFSVSTAPASRFTRCFAAGT